MLTTDDGRTISNPEEIANIDIYIDKEVSYIMENSSSDFDDILKDPITLKEIEDILIALPNNKAPGDDGITYEHIKHSGDILVGKLAILYNKIIEL